MLTSKGFKRYCLSVTSSNIFSNRAAAITSVTVFVTGSYCLPVTGKALSVNDLRGLLLKLLLFYIYHPCQLYFKVMIWQ